MGYSVGYVLYGKTGNKHSDFHILTAQEEQEAEGTMQHQWQPTAAAVGMRFGNAQIPLGSAAFECVVVV